MTVPAEGSDQDFDDLLLMLKETRGVDFAGYKRSTLARRVRRRMDARRLGTLSEYRDYLELEPDEFGRLFDSLLINVTGFFRDPPAWQALRESVLPELLAVTTARRPIRVWSAGCATGEEAYTLAIVLAEAMGERDFLARVKIYATDLDEDALVTARAGVYTERQVVEVDEDLRARYFEPHGARFAFRRDLRKQIIFGRNDLTRDAPISRVDLLVARNTLIYFNAEAQSNIIRKFHFALTDRGFLFLGKAEMLLNHGDQFEPVDLRKRLFRKISAPPSARSPRASARVAAGAGEAALNAGLTAAALAAGPVAQLVIDQAGRLAAANVRAETLFGLRPRDVGRPFQDLEVSYRPVELRSVIEDVVSDHRPVELSDVVWRRTAAEPSYFDITVVPLHRISDELIGVAISFVDMTRHRRLRDELERANQDLEHAYDALQSLNEERETANEELQSTNEELETANEELQSANDELQAINDVLRLRSEELDSSQAFLTSVLRSLGSAALVVDRELRVTLWDQGAEDFWGVRAAEAVGRPASELDIGLPVEEILPLLRHTIAGEPARGEITVTGANRRGRPVLMRIQGSRLVTGSGEPDGVLLTMNRLDAQT